MGRLYGKEPFQPSRIIARILACVAVFELVAATLAALGMLLIGQQPTFLALFRNEEYTAFSGRGWVVIFSHLLAAFATASAFPFIVIRAKKALDFAFTLHFLHACALAACDASTLGNGGWWLVSTLSLIITAALGEYLTLRREMSDISVEDILRKRGRRARPASALDTPAHASHGGATPVTGGGSVAGTTSSGEGVGQEWFPLARPLRGIFRSRYARLPGEDPGLASNASGSGATVAQDSSAIRVGPLTAVSAVTASPGGDAPLPHVSVPVRAAGSMWWSTSPRGGPDVGKTVLEPEVGRAVAARLMALEARGGAEETQSLLVRSANDLNPTGLSVEPSASSGSLDTLPRGMSDTSLDAAHVAAAARSRVHAVSPAPQPGALMQRSVDLPATTPRHILFPVDAPSATPAKSSSTSVPPTPQPAVGFRQRVPASGLVTRRAVAVVPSSSVAATTVHSTAVTTVTSAAATARPQPSRSESGSTAASRRA